ncbi:hypothetical protein [Azospirillum sp. SYSU D00513]|uniref:hypothetical protein n=1 Tax=Azospirillum sp. SYSU D00513 TaxID=2812561 RepID=UPI001A97698C|nr:hypothetical protein [Azospirillum sp. SYSU D00513]
MIRTMSNAAVHFGGGVAMGVLGVFAAAGLVGMMMGGMMGGRSSPLESGRNPSPSLKTTTDRYGRTPDNGL